MKISQNLLIISILANKKFKKINSYFYKISFPSLSQSFYHSI